MMQTPKPLDTTACAVHLRTAVMDLSRQLRSGMQHDGLPLAMLGVLGHLHRSGSMTPTELARRQGVKLQSLTRLLAELEAKGWMQRSTHTADARQSLLAITARGQKRLGEAAKGADAPLAQAIATRLSRQDQVLLVQTCALLTRLGDALQSDEATV